MKKIAEFERNSITLFILMMSANVCNYLFQIIVGNMLSVVDYGIVNTVLSVVGILSIPTTIVSMVCARYIAIFATVNNQKGIFSALRLLFKLVLLLSVLLLVVVLFGQKEIAGLLNIPSSGYILGALFISIVNLILSITVGSLQGLKKFFEYGIQTIFVAAAKLAISILLIILGWRVYGVILAIFVGTFIAIIFGFIHTSNYIKGAFAYQDKKIIDMNEFCKFAVTAIISQGCIIAITNGDILLVKIYFSDTEAGVYSSAMVIGKIAMYISTAIIAALFPMVVDKNQKGDNTLSLLKKALFYGGGMAVACGLGMILFGKHVIAALFGERYTTAIEYLPFVCVYVISLTFITILMNYILAIGNAKLFSISIGLGLACIVVMSNIFHQSIPQMISMSSIIISVLFILNLFYIVSKERKNNDSGAREDG